MCISIIFMQPRKSKNEVKQQKIKDKREEKDAQQQKVATSLVGKPTDRLK